ncbi:MAG TPA: putative Ig domain-containing protein, partial [Acetobacteraceae bacterium]|nr:putative Ig domain-containing protein [Acetobacteraceae bacterium]
GSSSDIIIQAPHLASQEWAGVAASSVVIYELDTPIVADTTGSCSIAFHATLSLGPLFSATDPASRTITEWQIYDTATGDFLVLNGIDYGDHSAASALTVASLSSVALLAGSVATTDTLDVRAYNGTYWGDWTALSVAVAGSAASAPVLKMQTPAQTWKGGTAISLAVAFTDPQNEALTYGAQLANGQTLPSWLVFNAATDTFSGTPPATAQTLNIVVTATDTSHLAATDSFTATILGAPLVTAQTSSQTWTEGKAVSLTLAANSFTDPQGEKLAYTATLSNGQALPAWLRFNATTETFSGTAPSTAQTLGIKVTATDSSGLATSESFTATIQPAPAPTPRPGITVSDPTPNQIWTDAQNVTLVLPANTFTDALGLKMSFAAYEVSGPNVTSWLHFNASTDTLSGAVPANASGTIGLLVLATDAQNVRAEDMFNVTFASSSLHGAAAVTIGLPGAASLSGNEPMSGLVAFHS